MSDKYRRVKMISYLLIATKKVDPNGKEAKQVVPYENNAYITFVQLVIFVDLLKNFYFLFMPISLNDRLLYGDIIISFQDDQRLYNLLIIVCYISTISYFFFLLFGKQKTDFYRLSKFLYVWNPRQYSRRMLVSQEFAGQFSRWLDLGVLSNQLVFCNYLIFTTSFYSKTLYKSISLGFGFKEILYYSFPSIAIGAFALLNFYRVAVQAYIFFILYVRLMNAKLNRLASDLDELDDSLADRRRLFKHFADLDSVVSEYRLSRQFFEITLVLAIPAVLTAIALLPTNILMAENILTNQLVLFFFINLFLVLIPIVNSNEKFKRELHLYLSSVHRFMARTKRSAAKLKLMKIMDIAQTTSPFTYSLLGGVFDLEMEVIPIILAESFALTFLIYPLIYYAQS